MYYYFIIFIIIILYYIYKLQTRLVSIFIILDKLQKKIDCQFIYYTYDSINVNNITDYVTDEINNEYYNIDENSDSILSNNINIQNNNDKIYLIL